MLFTVSLLSCCCLETVLWLFCGCLAAVRLHKTVQDYCINMLRPCHAGTPLSYCCLAFVKKHHKTVQDYCIAS